MKKRIYPKYLELSTFLRLLQFKILLFCMFEVIQDFHHIIEIIRF